MAQRSTNPMAALLSWLVLFGVMVGVLYNFVGMATGSAISVVLFFIVFLIAGVRVIDQYDRGIVLTLGRFSGIRDPGLRWILPSFQRMIKVDIRVDTVDIPQQEVITRDNVTVGINAVVYFKVDNPQKAVLEVQDFNNAISTYAQAALRDVIGGVELDALLSERDKIADEIKKIVDVATEPWGIDVSSIKMQDIELPADMKRVMAKQAEAERERRAVIIQAEGEYSAAAKLSQAAAVLSATPGGISLRTLQTIEKINPDPSKTVIFALPIEFMEGIKSLSQFFKEKK